MQRVRGLQAAHARTERSFAEQLYAGTAQRRYQQGSLAEEFPGLDVSHAEFMHWSTVVGEYFMRSQCLAMINA